MIFPNAINTLDEDTRIELIDICSNLFVNISDIDEWKLNLLDVISKVNSINITSRLQLILEYSGTLVQFGSTHKRRYPDGLLSIKSILQMKKNPIRVHG